MSVSSMQRTSGQYWPYAAARDLDMAGRSEQFRRHMKGLCPVSEATFSSWLLEWEIKPETLSPRHSKPYSTLERSPACTEHPLVSMFQ